MTRSEAKRSLVMAFPGRSISIQISDWSHRRENGTRWDSHDYTAHILPGLDGSPCSRFEAQNLTDLLAEVRKGAVASPPPTEDELDQHFEETESEEMLTDGIRSVV